MYECNGMVACNRSCLSTGLIDNRQGADLVEQMKVSGAELGMDYIVVEVESKCTKRPGQVELHHVLAYFRVRV